MDLPELSKSLAAFRLARELTQEQIATHFRVTQQTIANWEKGKLPGRARREQLAQYLRTGQIAALADITEETGRDETDRFRIEDFSDCLPPEIRNNTMAITRMGLAQVRNDFLSAKLCVEIKTTTTPRTMPHTMAEGLWQLSTARTIHRERHAECEHYVLILVGPAPDNSIIATTAAQAVVQGIDVRLAADAAEAAALVADMEFGPLKT